MKVSMICCPFQTSYGVYGSSLIAALQNRMSQPVQWVGSNCGCGDPIEISRLYQAQKCDYFEMPVVGEYQSKRVWKREARAIARSVLFSARARRFSRLSQGAEVVHFQQILNAYGSKTVFAWLKLPSDAVRVVTVHELDADQQKAKAANVIYNRADAILVHCQDLKNQLVKLNVQSEKVHVVLHGTPLPEHSNQPRSGIVFYGGHKLMTNKGLDSLLEAMSILTRRMGDRTPLLSIHGHYGVNTPPEAVELAQKHGVTDKVAWLNQIPQGEVTKLYQRSLLCALPYVGSFAGGAAGHAAACGLPVIGTRRAGLPDHLAEAGIWVEEKNAAELADRIEHLLSDDGARKQAAERSLARAQKYLGWGVIAEQTLQIYRNCNGRAKAA